MNLLTKEECKSTKDVTEYLLQHFPVTRDDSFEMWLIYLEEFHSLKSIMGHDAFMKFREIIFNKRTLSVDALAKTKSKFQADGNYWGENMRAKQKIEELKASQWAKNDH